MYGYCKTEAKFTAWLQSAMRQVWAKHPVKLSLIEKKRVAMRVGTSKRPVYHIQCYHCKKLFKQKEIEVNHIATVGGLSDISKLNEFVHNLLVIKDESELELLCKGCHSIITYMERYNVPRRKAIIEKKVIAFSKLPDDEQFKKCNQAGIKPVPKTKIGRKNAVRDYLEKNMP